MSEFEIDLTESFPLLGHAPIVEAVIEVRARAEAPWEEQTITEGLKAKLPGYFFVHSQQAMRFELKMGSGQSNSQPEQSFHDLGWRGLRCESEDKLHIAQFNRDGFVFSRLKPYEGWDQFQREGLRLWRLYMELAQPVEIQRLGLRFINRIPIPQEGSGLGDYLEAPPGKPRKMDLPFSGFFHHDMLTVPGYPYVINFIQTVQPPQGLETGGLILDIDVFTTQPFSLDQDVLEQYLAEMRWLKNKVFFGSITQKALETLK